MDWGDGTFPVSPSAFSHRMRLSLSLFSLFSPSRATAYLFTPAHSHALITPQYIHTSTHTCTRAYALKLCACVLCIYLRLLFLSLAPSRPQCSHHFRSTTGKVHSVLLLLRRVWDMPIIFRMKLVMIRWRRLSHPRPNALAGRSPRS
jgi:hypothetical protein